MLDEEESKQAYDNKIQRRSSVFTVVNDLYFYDLKMDYNYKNLTHCDFFNNNKSKLLNGINNFEEKINIKNNLLGIFYLFISVFLFSVAHLISKFLIIYFPKVENLANNFIRGVILILISHILLRKRKINMLKQLKSNNYKSIILVVRCFFGAICNITLFESFKFMRISSAFTIFCTYPIFVSILSIFILKSSFYFLDFMSYLACIIAVFLISKPVLFFPNKSNETGSDTAYGVFLSILSALLNAIGVYLNKTIAFDFDNLISTFFFGFWFILSSGLLLPFTEYSLMTLDFASFSLITLSSLIFFLGVILFVEALNVGEPIKILPVFYFGIIFSLIYNSVIFGKTTDFLDILGSFIIIFFNVLGTFNLKSSSK